jgi:hypothetical protein
MTNGEITIENKAEYFSIHSVYALNNGEFSIICANIPNTKEKISLAKEIFPVNDWHIQFHNDKINMSWMIT